MVNAQNTKISMDIAQIPDTNQVSGSNNLWSYHKMGTINGVPVRQQDKNLNIDTQKDLLNAFQLDNQIVVWTGWLSPQHPQDMKVYQNIKQLEAQNKCIILEHQLQYSNIKDAFLVLMTYANIQFKLNTRYSFYKQDLIHE